MVKKKKIGFGITGSFCTHAAALAALQDAARLYDVIPVLSEAAAKFDTRFGKASEFTAKITEICGKPPRFSIPETEPFGPNERPDAYMILPCTGNSMAKIALGITDTPVVMGAKSVLRNGKPVIIALASNDALSANAQNLGRLLARRNIYFVPMRQDDALNKPTSLIADFSLCCETIAAAMQGVQLQPLFLPAVTTTEK